MILFIHIPFQQKVIIKIKSFPLTITFYFLQELKRPMTTSANIVKVGEFKNKDDSHNHRNAFTGKKSMRADVIYSSDKFDLPDLSKNITTLLNTKKNNTKKAT